jgi:hypothetical protein
MYCYIYQDAQGSLQPHGPQYRQPEAHGRHSHASQSLMPHSVPAAGVWCEGLHAHGQFASSRPHTIANRSLKAGAQAMHRTS